LIHGSMKYDDRIHSKEQIIKALLGSLVSRVPLMKAPKNDLVVLNYHGTPKKFFNNFRLQVDYFREWFHIISPSELESFFKNKLEASNKPYLLFNFDDGIKNNLYAADVLNKYGIQALFFVVPEFINCKHERQSEYFLKNINPISNPQIEDTRDDIIAMSWRDLGELVATGHEVGSHSVTHMMKLPASDCSSRNYEIVESRRMIAECLNLYTESIRSFCAPVDTSLSVGIEELKLIRNNYKFFFSTFPGSNLKPKNPYFIKRVHVEAFWMLPTVKFALSNLERIRWRREVKLFENLR
jgi:hypothetical protein